MTNARHVTLFIAALIALAVVAAYHAAWRAPFIFDDLPAIVQNPTLHSLGTAWSPPPGGLPVSGRPLVNVTLALNHALGGLAPAGYHAVNLGLHVLAAWTLFGLVCHTWRRRAPEEDEATIAGWAGAVALLWALHPLQTAAVTYIAQRAEVLAALCYLLTLAAFARVATSPPSRGWGVVSVVCCLLGMLSKETMVTAPVVVLLYDRVFVAGSFASAWRARRGLYLGYAATWIVLAWLVAAAQSRGGTAGFGLNVTPWAYALTQTEAIARYLGLVFWPSPLVFDYGPALTRDWGVVAAAGTLLVLLLAAVGWLWRRWPAGGFLGAAFFLLLAPSSSFVPVVTQTIAEHRMYLALAVPLIAVAVGLRRGLGPRGWVVLGVAAVALGAVTSARNADYASAFDLWRDTVAKRPDNFRARYNLGLQWLERGRPDEAVAETREAARRTPENPDAHFNLALMLTRTGQPAEAVVAAETSLRLRPGAADGWLALGNALLAAGRGGEAVPAFARAVEIAPQSFAARNNLGSALARLGRGEEAVAQFTEARRLRPDDAEARGNLAEAHVLLGGGLLQAGKPEDAMRHYAEARRLEPGSFSVHFNSANALARLGRMAEAADEYREAIRLKPDFAPAHANLGYAWLQQGRREEAAREFQAALEFAPDDLTTRHNLARLWLQGGRTDDAIREAQELARRAPAMPAAQNLLAEALARAGRTEEARTHFAAALRLRPDDAEARAGLERLGR